MSDDVLRKVRSDVFDVLRRHDVSEQCFAEVAMVTHAALAIPPGRASRPDVERVARTKPAHNDADGPEAVYLAPLCCVDPHEGRLWCEDDVFEDCGEPNCRCASTKYVRADLAAIPPGDCCRRMREALEGLLGWGAHDEGCRTDPTFGKPGAKRCDCGLDKAETAARAALAPPAPDAGGGDATGAERVWRTGHANVPSSALTKRSHR